MQKEKACVVIPVYKKITNPLEIIALQRGLSIFRSYKIFFFCPNSFEESWLSELIAPYDNVYFKKFEDRYFKGIKRGYNNLLLTDIFYEAFSNFEFMLIYQSDAYVFTDELNYWCDKGYDYIGAPWFRNFDESGKENEFIENAGNGGFSLRKIDSFIRALHKNLTVCELLKLRKILKKNKVKPHSKSKIIFNIEFFKFLFVKRNLVDVMNYVCANADFTNEDYFFACIVPLFYPQFKVAKAVDAVAFSFECSPQKLFAMNNNKLPFGCHAWYKYEVDFWKKFIDFN